MYNTIRTMALSRFFSTFFSTKNYFLSSHQKNNNTNANQHSSKKKNRNLFLVYFVLILVSFTMNSALLTTQW